MKHRNEEMKMKITGYALREALTLHELRSRTAAGSFDGSLKSFDDEEKDSPTNIVNSYLTAETAIAKLQVVQLRYNLAVNVDVNGETMTLAEAIERVGGDARAEKFWRSAATPKTDRYGYGGNDTRDPNLKVAKATLSATEATKLATQAAKRAGGFRQAIAVGNSREVEIQNLDNSLFE